MEILYHSYKMRWAKSLNWHKKVNNLKNDNVIFIKFTLKKKLFFYSILLIVYK